MKLLKAYTVNIYTKACITKGSKGESLTDMEKLSSHSSVVAFSIKPFLNCGIITGKIELVSPFELKPYFL